jgi:hypothetical protein
LADRYKKIGFLHDIKLVFAYNKGISKFERTIMTQPVPLPPTYQTPQKTNTLAIVGFVLAFFLSFVGAILGLVALDQIKKSAGMEGGKGLAIAAVVIGFVPLVVIFLLALLGPAIGGVFNNITNAL